MAARIAFHEDRTLAAGEHAVAQLRLEAPAFVFAGDRFIVRDWAERTTLGGAIVLDRGRRPKAFSPRRADAISHGASRITRGRFALGCIASRVRGRDTKIPVAPQVALQCR